MSAFELQLRKVLNDKSGATAIEFAILVPVFILFLLAIIDFGILYFTNSRLERGVFIAEMKLSEGWKPETHDMLRQLICREADINCGEKGFHVQVAPLTANSPLPSSPVTDSTKLVPGQAHVIRIVYPWSGVFPVGMLTAVGMQDLLTKTISPGFFFHVKS